MCSRWLTGPERARLARRVVANGEDEIGLRCAWRGELMPGFGAQTGGVVPQLSQPPVVKDGKATKSPVSRAN
jgi:hypothetical protein